MVEDEEDEDEGSGQFKKIRLKIISITFRILIKN
jgi:hypothetical protein